MNVATAALDYERIVRLLEREVRWPAIWWGTAFGPPPDYDQAWGAHPDLDAGGLPVPLRSRYAAPEDAEADALLEPSAPGPQWHGYVPHFDRGSGVGTLIWVRLDPSHSPAVDYDVGENLLRSGAAITSRELRARLLFSLTVKCKPCDGAGRVEDEDGDCTAPTRVCPYYNASPYCGRCEEYETVKDCPACHGTGRVTAEIERVPVAPEPLYLCREGQDYDGGSTTARRNCPPCGGKGEHDFQDGQGLRGCSDCDGTGDWIVTHDSMYFDRDRIEELARRNSRAWQVVGAPGAPDVVLEAGELVIGSRLVSRAWLLGSTP